jgi:DNA repair photolyase
MNNQGIKKKKKSTKHREWTEKYANLISGCAHDCKYCYAKASAVLYKQNTPANWKNEVIRDPYLLKKKFQKRKHVLMIPSSHDITPQHLKENMVFLYSFLDSGNKLLIVSKPHFNCIKAICDVFFPFKNQILFRFTIGSADSAVLKFWEPNAPDFEERLESLKYAFNAGYQTSVSCEPMLDDNIDQVIAAVLPYVTETIWIGKPTQLNGRLSINGFKNDVATMGAARRLMGIFSDDFVLDICERYWDNTKIMSKNSVKDVIKRSGCFFLMK